MTQFILWLLLAGASAQCDTYKIKVGSAVPNNYEGEWGIEAAVKQLNEVVGGIKLGSNEVCYKVEFKNYAHDNTSKDEDEVEHKIQMDQMLAEVDFVIGG